MLLKNKEQQNKKIMPRQRNENRTYIPRQIKYAVLNECNYTCAHCGKSILDARIQTLEHVIPLNKGGSNEINNFVALCHDCNEEKSDDIIAPKDYYPYLPAEKMKQVQAVFNDYIHNTRWLANDTLFKTDRFEIISHTIFHKLRGEPIIFNIPVQLQKMRNTDVIEYLNTYAGRLDWKDKELIIHNEKQIETSYYRITTKDDFLGIMTAYVQKHTSQTPVCEKSIERNVLFIDMFANPEIKISQKYIEIMAYTLQGILMKIRETLKHHAPKTTMEIMVRCPYSDKLFHTTMNWLTSSPIIHLYPFTLQHGRDAELSARIYAASGLLYQGNHHDIVHLEKTVKPEDELDYRLNIMQKPIDEELSLSKTVGEKKIKKPTKKEKKHATKKRNKKRRK